MGHLIQPRVGKSGSYALAAGAQGGAVTWDDLGWTPTHAQLAVTKPGGGDNVFPNLTAATLTSTGFSFTLNGIVPDAGYTLNWVVEIKGW